MKTEEIIKTFYKNGEENLTTGELELDESVIEGLMVQFVNESETLDAGGDSISAEGFADLFMSWLINYIGIGEYKVVGSKYEDYNDRFDRLFEDDAVDMARELWKENEDFRDTLFDKWNKGDGDKKSKSNLRREEYHTDRDVDPREELNKIRNKGTLMEFEDVDDGLIKNGDEEDVEDGKEVERVNPVDDTFKDPDDDVESEIEPIEFDGSSVHNGDCVEISEAYSLGNDRFIDAVITDPPYGMEYDSRGDFHNVIFGDGNVEEAMELIGAVMSHTDKILKKGAPVIMFCGDSNLAEVIMYMRNNYNFHQVVVWDKEVVGTSAIHGDIPSWRPMCEFMVYGTYGKPDWTNSNRHDGDVIHEQKLAGANMEHPTQKPEELMRYVIESVTQKGDVVFDPFVGSGTTAVACKQTGRKYLACEVDDEHYKTTVERLKSNSSLAQFT